VLHFPLHVVDVILAWQFPLLPFKKYATESLQGCEGAKYVYDLDIQTTTSNI